MAQQTINLGAAPNDGTGDDLRTAGDKINDNFTELYGDVSDLDTAVAGKQASDSDLTAIAVLSPSNDDIIQRKAGAWANRTIAQLRTDLGEVYASHPGFIAGNWYAPFPGGEVAAGAAVTANSIRLCPFYLPRPITVSDLGCRITTLAGGGNIQLAIYASNASTGQPTGNPLASTGSIATDAAGAFSADITGANVLLVPGLYWAAVIADNATVVLQMVSGGNTFMGWIAGAPTLANVTFAATGATFIRTFGHTFGTWPDLTGQTMPVANSNAFGLVFLKAA